MSYDERTGSVRGLFRKWGREALSKGVAFTIDRLLELEAELDEEDDLEDLDEIVQDAVLEEIGPPLPFDYSPQPQETYVHPKLRPDSRVSDLHPENVKLHSLAFKDEKGETFLTFDGPEYVCEVLTLRAGPIRESLPPLAVSRVRVAGVTFSCKGSKFGLISDLVLVRGEQRTDNLLASDGWVPTTMYRMEESVKDLPELKDYALIDLEEEYDDHVYAEIKVMGAGADPAHFSVSLVLEEIWDGQEGEYDLLLDDLFEARELKLD